MIDFVSGEAVSGYFYEDLVPGVGAFGGFDNRVGGALVESPPRPGGGRVRIMASSSLVARSGDGARDPGLDGVIDGGDAQFRALFVVTGAGTSLIEIGHGFLGESPPCVGGCVPGEGNAQILIDMSGIRIVPEPGPALLLGLGLACAAANRRRE